MPKLDVIEKLLPYTFTNGSIITRFAKRCPHCKVTVESNDMLGKLVSINDLLFVSASANCVSCGHKFNVACVINNQRRIKPALIPKFFFDAILSAMPDNRVTGQQVPDRDFSPSEFAKLAPFIPSLSSADVVEANSYIGSYDGITIPEWIEHQGRRMDFVRVIPKNLWPKLSEEECLYRERLVFR